MSNTFQHYMDCNKLVMDTINRQPTDGIPATFVFVMQHDYLDRLANAKPGEYVKNPVEVYIEVQRNIGVKMIDQFVPLNPLEMGNSGYEDKLNTATTGADKIVLDGMLIDSPEAVVEHIEKFVFPQIRQSITDFDETKIMDSILNGELETQQTLGEDFLKCGYGFIYFPYMGYYQYGYENYFMAYALYPEIIEKHFSIQADGAVLHNSAVAKLYKQKLLPPFYRLDHDVADSRGTLVDIKSLDRMWFPHFARSLEPLLKTDVKLIWHCDGNLMQMLPRLLEVGLDGFQGFQYEDGMDYIKICKMKTRDGESPIIQAGVSVTTTMPFGTPSDVRNELKFLVENGPKTGLFLGASSSVAPGVPWENVLALVDGLAYYGNGSAR